MANGWVCLPASVLSCGPAGAAAFDVVVYGGTAAIPAARKGSTVALVEPG